MTYSICVRETYSDENGNTQKRFGVGITTRVACIGVQSPFVSKSGAASSQSGGISSSFNIPNIELRKKAVEYVEDGVPIESAINALLDADSRRSYRQTHGVDSNTEYAHTGDNCGDWAGHIIGDNYTVAGNLLAGKEVVEQTSRKYENSDRSVTLSERLIDALEAGFQVGGDKRSDDLPIQSASIKVESTENHAPIPYYSNIRVDATETPISDLQETYEKAKESYSQHLKHREYPPNR